MKIEHAIYQVGLKLLLRKNGEFLFLKDGKGKWDLPGGRIDNFEHNTSLMEVLKREIDEELGTQIKYNAGKPLFQYRKHLENKGQYIFLTVYDGEYLSGEIKLSSEHTDYQWINPKIIVFNQQDFSNQEEYFAFKNYFNK